ncbi:MAG: nucleotide pyrophosphatase/phosphodiesterase family protein [Verrucomicrobiota bacterium]
MGSKLGPICTLFCVLAVAAAYLPFQLTLETEYERNEMEGDREYVEYLVAMGRVEESFTPTTPDPTPTPSVESDAPDPINYVLWLNISGFRGDYVDNSSAPFFAELANASHSTARMSPTFPSVHWPSLVSQATGLQPAQHGVIGESMRDPETGEIVLRPTNLQLLKGEPIWTTAKRQGIRVLVHDWPFSQEQPDEHAADIFLPEFDPDLSDEDRLKALLDAWTSDTGEEKIRLVMANLQDLNKAGERHGARSDSTYLEFEKLDKTISGFFDDLSEAWPKLNRGKDVLWVFLTTDHGMGEVKSLINFDEFVSEEIRSRLKYSVDHTIAHLWLDLPEGTNQEKFIEAMDDELGTPIFWKMYRPEEMPENWNFPTEGVGERILALQPGYRFTTKSGPEPIYGVEDSEDGPFATGGYAPSTSSRMRGQAYIFTFPEPSAASDMKSIYAVQLYPTACQLLGIIPAADADAQPLEVDSAAAEEMEE